MKQIAVAMSSVSLHQVPGGLPRPPAPTRRPPASPAATTKRGRGPRCPLPTAAPSPWCLQARALFAARPRPVGRTQPRHFSVSGGSGACGRVLRGWMGWCRVAMQPGVRPHSTRGLMRPNPVPRAHPRGLWDACMHLASRRGAWFTCPPAASPSPARPPPCAAAAAPPPRADCRCHARCARQGLHGEPLLAPPTAGAGDTTCLPAPPQACTAPLSPPRLSLPPDPPPRHPV